MESGGCQVYSLLSYIFLSFYVFISKKETLNQAVFDALKTIGIYIGIFIALFGILYLVTKYDIFSNIYFSHSKHKRFPADSAVHLLNFPYIYRSFLNGVPKSDNEILPQVGRVIGTVRKQI